MVIIDLGCSSVFILF
jgi:hypothetical protein